MFFLGSISHAQVPRALPGAVEPGHDRPLPTPPPPGGFDFSIETPRPSPVPRAVDELRFQLRGIRVVGASALSQEELKSIYAGYVGKEVGFTDILNIASAIETAYREKGYAIVRAYVPPQRVGDGVFTINVVEGYVNAIALDGGDEGVRSLITGYTQPILTARPLDLATAERGLLLSNDLPGVAASALLRPSPDQPGATDMVVSVKQTPWSGGLNIDNRGSRFTDLWTGGGDVEWNSPTGSGDQVSANVQSAPNPTERIAGTFRYQRPLGGDGLTGSAYVTVSHGQPGAGLGQFDIVTDSLAIGPRVSYPLIRMRDHSLFLEGGLTYQDATVNALGTQLSRDHWRVADIAATYTQTGFWSGNSSAVVDLAQGLPFFGATENGSPSLSRVGAHTDFTKVTATVRRAQVLWGPVSAAVTAQGQYAFEPLVAGEQMTFGGYQIGRGYDPSALSGDIGLGGSFELRYDHRFVDFVVQAAQPYVFFDTGKIWNRLGGNGSGLAVASTGVGIRVSLPENITGGIEFAETLKAVPGSDNGQRTGKVLVNAAIRF